MTKPVINIADVEPEPRPAAFAPSGQAAERFDAKMGFIAPRIGAQKLGYNITVVPPGKRGFPFHNHRVNEEMFFILQGSGEVRIGETTYPIRTGDVIACPPGGAEAAHQIVNTGRFGLLADFPAGADGKPKRMMFVGREGESLDYWEGE